MSDLIKGGSVVSEGTTDTVTVGQWYWYSVDKNRNKYHAKGAPSDRLNLGFVSHIGTNYVELTSSSQHGTQTVRVLHTEFWEKVRLVDNPDNIIRDTQKHHKDRLSRLLNNFNLLVDSMTGASDSLLPNLTSVGTGPTGQPRHLVPNSSTRSIQLPKLEARIKEQSKLVAHWEKMHSLQIEIEVKSVKTRLALLDKKLDNLSIYTGTSEYHKTIRDGQHAHVFEKVHVFQRLLFMDEECLVDYEHGGMDITNIEDFDRWLAKDENFNRVLPNAKSVVAFRVRRWTKVRDTAGLSAFVRIRLDQSDKWTYLYVRNGDKLSRFTYETFEFGDSLFPRQRHYEENEPLVARSVGTRNYETITLREYEDRKAEVEELAKKELKWASENKYSDVKKAKFDELITKAEIEYKDKPKELKKERYRLGRLFADDHYVRMFYYNNPYKNNTGFNPSDWKPFDKTNVHYDDIVSALSKKADTFNKVALILQGILDRSDALSPHPSARLWVPQEFDSLIKLVYDYQSLPNGPEPDLNAYIERCNALANNDSVFIGQQELWERHEANKMNDRNFDNDYTRYKPDGNEGPTEVAHCLYIKPRAKEVVFSWYREIVNYNSPKYGKKLKAKFTTPLDTVFNASAYKLGDYKQFYEDHRTRQKYLKWAPILLRAEEYAAGLIEATPAED